MKYCNECDAMIRTSSIDNKPMLCCADYENMNFYKWKPEKIDVINSKEYYLIPEHCWKGFYQKD